VIAGEFRSRKLQSVEGVGTRPTSDRLRETLFNIIGPQVQGCVFVDAYAGTGACGLEALSRGARQAVLIEKDKKALDTIRANIRSLGAESRTRVIAGSASKHLDGIAADIVFLDPPYEQDQEYDASFQALEKGKRLCLGSGLVVIQHSVRFSAAEEYGRFQRYRVVRQGDNALAFYRPASGIRS
jgi:16S rRNA (guanine(966)-N(2))-methyltransferase RsmD